MYEVAAGELNSLSRANLSALGQKQTFAVHQPMSALPPRADNRLHFSHTEGASWVMARVLCSRSRLSLRHQYNVWTTFVTSVRSRM